MRGTRDRAVYRRPLRAWSFSEGKVVAKAKNEALLCALFGRVHAKTSQTCNASDSGVIRSSHDQLRPRAFIKRTKLPYAMATSNIDVRIRDLLQCCITYIAHILEVEAYNVQERNVHIQKSSVSARRTK